MSRNDQASGRIDIDAWRHAIRNDTFSHYHYAMGAAIELEGDKLAAVAAYRRAIEIKPDLWAAHVRLVDSLATTGLTAEADQARSQATVLSPYFYCFGCMAIARGLIEEQKEDQAAAWLTRAAGQTGPTEAAHCLGLLHLLEGRRHEARQVWAAAPPITGNHAYALSEMAHGIGLKCAAKGWRDSAVAAYAYAAQHDLLDARRHLSLGDAMQTDGRVEAAAASFARARAVDPTAAEAYFRHGLVLDKLERKEAAIAAMRHGLSLTPRSPQAYAYTGIVLYQYGELVEAETMLGKSVALDPKVGWLHEHHSKVLLMLGRYKESEAAMRICVQMKRPHNTGGEEILICLARLGLDDLDAAENLARTLVNNENLMVSVHAESDIGLIAHKRGQFDVAEAAHRRALARRPDFGWTLVNLALVLTVTGRANEAAEAYRQALVGTPRRVLQTYHRMRPKWTQDLFEKTFPDAFQ